MQIQKCLEMKRIKVESKTAGHRRLTKWKVDGLLREGALGGGQQGEREALDDHSI